MIENEVYQKLADVICANDLRGGPTIATPEFAEILKIQYTPEEAQLAIQVGFSGEKLDVLVDRTGIDRGELKKMLNTMADKGTMWIDPGAEDPNYRALTLEGPGIVETAAWVDDFSWSGDLINRWSKYKNVWIEEIAKFGPVIPVWPASAALPPDSDPSEDVTQVIKGLGYWSVSNCPCKSFAKADESEGHCDHLLETCMNFGDIGRWAVKHGHGRELTCEEAIDLIRKCEQEGLFHTGLPVYGILCNCCGDACANLIGIKIGLPHAMSPSAFVAICDEETCSACMVCVDRCPVEAVKVDEVAVVNRDTCLGCGLCVVGCDVRSMRLERRPEDARGLTESQVTSEILFQ